MKNKALIQMRIIILLEMTNHNLNFYCCISQKINKKSESTITIFLIALSITTSCKNSKKQYSIQAEILSGTLFTDDIQIMIVINNNNKKNCTGNTNACNSNMKLLKLMSM